MTSAQLSMIAPPPSVAAVLGALTEETRIGQVDFSTRLAPETEPEPELDGYDEVVVPGEGRSEPDATRGDDGPGGDDQHAHAQEPAAAPAVALTSVPDLVTKAAEPLVRSERVHQVTGGAHRAEPATAVPTWAPVDAPTTAAPAPETVENAVTEPDVPARLQERIHGPARLQPDEQPTDSSPVDERLPTVEEIARLVIERMHDAELAMMRHLDAVQVEAARRSELLTAQAELDAELIRLSARRKAHSIVTAARVRAGEPVGDDDEDRRLEELSDTLSRFAEAVDELRPVDGRPVPWGRSS